MTTHHFQPIAAAERIQLLDIFRGLALGGILLVNMQIFMQPLTIMLLGSQASSSMDLVGESIIKFFFEGKFYVLFSMLFGYGFWIFTHKTSTQGNATSLYLRRTGILFLFGAMHVILLWGGDILVFYALFGLILLAFRNISNRGLIKWAIALGTVPAVITMLMSGLISLALMHPESAETTRLSLQQNAASLQALADHARTIYSSGSFSQIVGIRLREYLTLLPGLLFFYPMVLAMFLFGVWIARKGWLTSPQHHATLFLKTFRWSLILGLFFNTLYVVSFHKSDPARYGLWTIAASLGHTLGGLSFALCYTSGIILLIQKGGFGTASRLLAPVGRLALTNYLMQSILCTTIFLSYGGGLMGSLNIWQGMGLCILIFALQIGFSRLWLQHFHFGPFEWLWRSLTYKTFQPMRKNNQGTNT